MFRLPVKVLLVIGSLLPAAACETKPGDARGADSTGVILQSPPTPVRFGMLPYGDHTYAIIGAKLGWFEDVGIALDHRLIKVEEIIPSLRQGTLDVVSTPPGILFAAHDNAPNLVSFVFGDLFQGYAIMAQPNDNVRSYSDFVAEGMAPDAAIRATVQQMRGKRFAYPTEAAIQPFIDLVLEKGGLSRTDIRAAVLDDPLTVNEMRKRRADFQVGGVPSRLVLQREGFRPILSSVDLARGAAPTPNSPELTSILQNGWAASKNYYDRNRVTILRLASVNYRIMKFINDYPDSAIALHMPYLSEVSGQQFGPEEGRIIYQDLDPFVTFENQREWFHNPRNPLYYANLNGSILNSFIAQGIFRNPAPAVETVIYADDVYRELERLKGSADSIFRVLNRGTTNSSRRLISEARRQYGFYNYFDAERLARQVLASRGTRP
jgi:ABC-type nitrate/sulfonate/bicarbonate transport system substrate-binding protein/predicted CopG family antitoxin